jgi:sporulation protein YlmC with PRC-barrel domain
MLKRILATTALVAVAAGGAFAADEAPMTDRPMPVFSGKAGISASAGASVTAHDGQVLASNLLGATIYAGAGEDAERIGEVNDVVLASNGAAEAVVVGVGGFLGMGEKDVALEFERLNWVERDGDRRLTTTASKSEFESAPAFERTAMRGEARTGVDMVATVPPMPPKATDDRMAANETVVRPRDPRANLAAVERDGISAETLIGARVYDSENNDIGEIGDVIVTDDGQVSTFIVDVGGFLGIGEKQVAVAVDNLEIMKDDNGSLWVFTPYDEDRFEEHAAYSEDAYLSDPDGIVLR